MTDKGSTAARRPSAAEVAKVMRHAETLCAERGLRFTPIRREAYAVMLRHQRPLSAYQLLELMQAQQQRRLAPLTVYRALDFLVDSGLAHKLETAHAFVACDHPDEMHQSLYLLCTDCGSSEEVATERLTRLIDREASQRHFRPSRQVVEIEGLCSACAEPQP
ncbi:Fur family transcriptional regulator [Solimonas marina]|uniref:Transcriptional repressor n=1 Tax=Solimonas marina TaxID=2714601 RepID=A0A970B7J8_9GAMM|nr:transcriptional repressor [Solimonas marina]NKF21279.1 transcriptional repressor [Solimonas marina]